jgi:hypothetical protein
MKNRATARVLRSIKIRVTKIYDLADNAPLNNVTFITIKHKYNCLFLMPSHMFFKTNNIKVHLTLHCLLISRDKINYPDNIKVHLTLHLIRIS